LTLRSNFIILKYNLFLTSKKILTQLSRTEKNKLLVVLSLLSAIGPLAVTMYMPGFHIIAVDFGVSVSVVSLSLATYFVGLTLGHLFYGPLIDRFGRKRPMYVGLILYTGSTILCAFSPTVDWLIWSRFFLALGGCGGVVIARTIVRDFFDVKESAKFLSTLMLIMGLAPIIAPAIGGTILIYFNWRFIFLSLILLVIFLLVGIYYFLPPLKGEDTSVEVHIVEIFKSYFMILKDHTFLTFGLICSITYASLFAYITGSHIVYAHIFNFSEQQTSWAVGINAVGLIIGNQLNHLLLKKHSSKRITTFALVFLFGVITILLIGMEAKIFDSLIFMIFMFVFISLIGVLNPNTMALALSPFANEAGRAAALLGSMQMGLSALVAAIVGSLLRASVVPMLVFMTCFEFVALLIVVVYSFSRIRD
jgi:DHA1 family bicyclomycin/chloramphenicol resistance-like MFS transporter